MSAKAKLEHPEPEESKAEEKHRRRELLIKRLERFEGSTP